MKLNAMTTDQAADVLVKIADPAAEIMNDPKLDALINEITHMQNPTEAQQLSFLAFKLLPFLMKEHRKALYTILSAMTGKTEKELAKQGIKETITDIRDSFDHELIDFFLPSKEQTKNAATE